MTSITITGGGSVDQARAKIKQVREQLGNNSVPMRQVAVFLDQWVQRNFRSSGGNVGGWRPFRDGGRWITVQTKKNKAGGRRLDPSAKLLMDTGRLRLSFLPGVSGGCAYIGSDLPYAKFHDEGTARLPQRRILPKAEEVQADVVKIIDGWIAVRLK